MERRNSYAVSGPLPCRHLRSLFIRYRGSMLYCTRVYNALRILWIFSKYCCSLSFQMWSNRKKYCVSVQYTMWAFWKDLQRFQISLIENWCGFLNEIWIHFMIIYKLIVSLDIDWYCIFDGQFWAHHHPNLNEFTTSHVNLVAIQPSVLLGLRAFHVNGQF